MPLIVLGMEKWNVSTIGCQLEVGREVDCCSWLKHIVGLLAKALQQFWTDYCT